MTVKRKKIKRDAVPVRSASKVFDEGLTPCKNAPECSNSFKSKLKRLLPW
jgi:hypothetical protein